MARFYEADGQKTYGRSHGNRKAKKDKNKPKVSGELTLANGRFELLAGDQKLGNATELKWDTWSTDTSDSLPDIAKLMAAAETKLGDYMYTFRAKWQDDGIGQALLNRRIVHEPKPLPGQRVHSTHEVSVKPLQFQVRSVYVIRGGFGVGSATVHVNFTVPDRVTGQPLELTYYHPILDNNIQEYVAEEVGNAIRAAFDHEIREMLYLGQERFRDPHPEMKPIKVNQTAG